MYQALYRKYRPNNFNEVMGQEVIVRTLKNAIINNKISHAYLFTGMRGTGKTTIAKILAKTINCEHSQNAIPCETCVSCTQINEKKNIDIIEIDAASNNGVDEIRELRSKVALVPNISKYKVYIIDEVHMLTQGAFNALLKTLEEPPKHIVFILATTEPQKIPLTILSRCQRFDFKKLSLDEISMQLQKIVENEKLNMDKLAIREIARLSYGGMRDAISLLDQALAYSSTNITLDDIHKINGTLPHKKVCEFIDCIISNNIADILCKIDEYDNEGINFIKLIDEMILFLKNILFSKLIPNSELFDSQNKDIYVDFSNKIENFKIINYIEKLNISITEMKIVNNKRLVFELAIIKMLTDGESSKNIVTANTSKITEKEMVEKEKYTTIDKGDSSQTDNMTTPLPDCFSEIKNCRINNTLACYNRQLMLSLRKKIDILRSALINPDYSEIVALVLDAKINAASDEYIIFVFKDSRIADTVNRKILLLEEVIIKYLNVSYKLIAVDEEEWANVKKEFNSHIKTYTYTEEKFDIRKILENNSDVSSEKDVIKDLFDDVVSYE